MKALDRYLAGIFLRSFLLSVVALASLFLFQALLGEVLERGYSIEQSVIYQLLQLPHITVQMMPPSVLVATVFTLSSLNRTNELVACFSIGIGIRRIMALILSIVFIISCVIIVMQDRILPPSYKKRQLYFWREIKKRPDFVLDIKKDKIWYRSRNLIYNLRRFEPKTNTIYGMSVYTFDEKFNLVQLVDAEKAEFIAGGWKLRKGNVTLFSGDDPFPMTQSFEEKELVIGETPHDFREIEKEVEGLRLKELVRYIRRMKFAGADTNGFEVKLHAKISLSFIPLVMCVLAVPFAMRGRREGGMAKDLGLCLGITFFYWLFYSVGLSLGTNGALPPWLAAWLPSVIFAGLAAILIIRQQER